MKDSYLCAVSAALPTPQMCGIQEGLATQIPHICSAAAAKMLFNFHECIEHAEAGEELKFFIKENNMSCL